MSEENITEREAADQLGVSREVLKGLRRDVPLVEGVDWVYGPRNAVCITPGGLDLLYRELDVAHEKNFTGAAAAAEDAETGGALSVAEVMRLARESEAEGPVVTPVVVSCVVKSIPRNPKLLFCTSDEVKGEIRVKVNDNQKFVTGMQIRVRRGVMDVRGIWYLEGRSPRRKGKW